MAHIKIKNKQIKAFCKTTIGTLQTRLDLPGMQFKEVYNR